MPNTIEVIVYGAAFLVGPLVLHAFAVWYSKDFRWITSSVVVQVAFFLHWLAQHPQ